MTYQAKHGTVKFEVRDGIAYVTLNRPEARNSMNGDMQWDLSEVWPEVNTNREVQVVIVSGEGEVFSDWDESKSGGDRSKAATDAIRAYERKPDPALAKEGIAAVPQVQGLRHVGTPDRTRARPAKPVITAVNGACSGPALTFVSYADIVICSEDAQFFEPRAKYSQAPLEETLGMIHLGSVRAHQWLRMAYMGSAYKVSAQRAYELGMVMEVVPRGQLMHRATQLAEMIKEASPAAVRGVVAVYWKTVSKPYKEARLIAPLDAQQARTMDGKEGYLAWVEKRTPVWPSTSLFPWPPPWPPVTIRY